jgi:hypothetical protein
MDTLRQDTLRRMAHDLYGPRRSRWPVLGILVRWYHRWQEG